MLWIFSISFWANIDDGKANKTFYSSSSNEVHIFYANWVEKRISWKSCKLFWTEINCSFVEKLNCLKYFLICKEMNQLFGMSIEICAHENKIDFCWRELTNIFSGG